MKAAKIRGGKTLLTKLATAAILKTAAIASLYFSLP
jgi:hypothetical protein